MSTVSYLFKDGINAFFSMPTENARRILPLHLQPLERQHGLSILSIAAFDFWESPIGAYQEVVMSLVVAPFIIPQKALPKAALYPYQVATTSKASREHAIERWRLPHWMEDVGISFLRAETSIEVSVEASGIEVVKMKVTDHASAPAEDLYQVFVQDGFMSDVVMRGALSEHEEELGSLSLTDHLFHQALELPEVEVRPFREQWIRGGTETFHPIEAVPHTSAFRR
jgi:hypothetical protein